jgi:hypothetical protein
MIKSVLRKEKLMTSRRWIRDKSTNQGDQLGGYYYILKG